MNTYRPLGEKCIITSNSEAFGADFGRLYGKRLATHFDVSYSKNHDCHFIWLSGMDDLERMMRMLGCSVRLDVWDMKNTKGLAIIIEDEYKKR